MQRQRRAPRRRETVQKSSNDATTASPIVRAVVGGARRCFEKACSGLDKILDKISNYFLPPPPPRPLAPPQRQWVLGGPLMQEFEVVEQEYNDFSDKAQCISMFVLGLLSFIAISIAILAFMRQNKVIESNAACAKCIENAETLIFLGQELDRLRSALADEHNRAAEIFARVQKLNLSSTLSISQDYSRAAAAIRSLPSPPVLNELLQKFPHLSPSSSTANPAAP
eukprot:m.240727 g.240727  ORF g.240727 m.240727 type:complete len:225 (+) comp23592_c0_seq1:217-891(+)